MINIIEKADILKVLRDVPSDNGESVVDVGIVSSVVIKENEVGFSLDISNCNIESVERLKSLCEEAVYSITGVSKVTVVLTKHIDTVAEKKKEYSKTMRKKKSTTKRELPGIKRVFLVSSGKGGVGKSTVAVNIAVKLSELGNKVGILDADIYGPSVPTMMGLGGSSPEIVDNRMIPMKSYGVKAISMGMFLDDDRSLVWRGPMLSKALHQLFNLTKWGELDYLIVDMPPGTGDVALSISENYCVNGVIIVSTPQKISLVDVRRACDMYKRLNVPLLGIVENMSYFVNNTTKEKIHVFGDSSEISGYAQELGIPILGQIPLVEEICLLSDKGTPPVLKEELADYYMNVVSKII